MRLLPSRDRAKADTNDQKDEAVPRWNQILIFAIWMVLACWALLDRNWFMVLAAVGMAGSNVESHGVKEGCLRKWMQWASKWGFLVAITGFTGWLFTIGINQWISLLVTCFLLSGLLVEMEEALDVSPGSKRLLEVLHSLLAIFVYVCIFGVTSLLRPVLGGAYALVGVVLCAALIWIGSRS